MTTSTSSVEEGPRKGLMDSLTREKGRKDVVDTSSLGGRGIAGRRPGTGRPEWGKRRENVETSGRPGLAQLRGGEKVSQEEGSRWELGTEFQWLTRPPPGPSTGLHISRSTKNRYGPRTTVCFSSPI